MGQVNDYDSLRAELTGYTKHADIPVQVDTLIQLTEARMNRVLRTLHQEERAAPASIPAGGQRIGLPRDWVGGRVVRVRGEPWEQVTPVQLDLMIAGKSRTGCGRSGNGGGHIAIADSQIRFWPYLDDTMDPTNVEILYFAAIPGLSSSNTTNWAVLKYPDAYITGGMAEAGPFLKDDRVTAVWEQKFSRVLEEIQEDDLSARDASSPRRVRMR